MAIMFDMISENAVTLVIIEKVNVTYEKEVSGFPTGVENMGGGAPQNLMGGGGLKSIHGGSMGRGFS